ncbi:unnamed protein product [Trichogramma brassicae]|uniref:RNA-directed DNA polymerase n=1 Tax=Trichogramma brassicae TaxID=86971 RepID=A0A6H5I838_9HYME|nr:unnamed protein product [Trichogramma brassicae]
MVTPREDNRLGNVEERQHQPPGANGQMNQDQQQRAPGANDPMNQLPAQLNQDLQQQGPGANGQMNQLPGQMIQQQLQAGLIDRPIQPGAGRVDDVPPQGVGAVSNCRLPAFWRTGPELWFFQIESQFQRPWTWRPSPRSRTSSVDRLTRRNTTHAQDGTDLADDGLTRGSIAQAADRRVELGDRRPSQLLRRHMRTLAAPANVSDEVLRSRWLDPFLPPQTRRLLLVIRNQSLEELAAVADEAHEVGPSVMAASYSPRRSQSPSNQVAQELAELRRAIEQLTTITRESVGSGSGHRGRSRSRGTRSARIRSPTPANNARTGYCWYHATHGDVADNSGKLELLALNSALTASNMQESRLYVIDRGNDIRFLVDSGSVLSIIPKKIFRRPLVKQALVLQAANATLIATFGEKRLTLNIGVRRPLEWTFIIADVSTAILGADFIIRHDLLIDLPRRRLLDDRLTNVAASCSVGPLPEVHAVSPVTAKISEAPVESLYQRMAEEFASTEVPAGEMACIPDLPVQHHIVTAGQPVFTRPRRRSQESVSKQRRANSQICSSIPVAPDDIPKTAVTTPFGLFEFVGMPLGLRNSAQTFQRAMNHLLRDLPFIRCYQDDILVLSTGHEEHARHLRELFTVLRDAKLHVKLDQVPAWPGGGHLRGVPRAVSRVQPRSWHPLTELLRGLVKKKEKLTWTPEAEAAFERTKKAMTEAVRSSFLSPSQPLALYTDASDTAIGAALNQQRESGVWVPLGFFSRKLSPTEQRYSTYDRELLAIHAAIKHFQRILEGRSFRILTDHKPLSYALEQRTDKHSPRQARQLDFIAQFRHRYPAYSRRGQHGGGRAVSRRQYSHADRDYDEGAQITLDDNELVVVERDGVLRPYIPVALRRAIFDSVHRLSHPSGRATAKRIELNYFWPSLRKDVGRWAKQCMPCQLSKVHRHNRSELGNFNARPTAVSSTYISTSSRCPVAGMSKLSHHHRQVYARWPEAIPLTDDITAQSVAEALYNKHWIAFFGAPLTITTDQGAQFESKLLKQLGGMIGAKHIHTSPYHPPQANAMVERLHRTLKAAFKCSPETPWTSALPTVLLGLRTAFKEDLQASPAEMVFGTALRIPGELVIKQEATSPRLPSSSWHCGTHATQAVRFQDLSTCEYVMRRLDTIKKPLDPPYSGPHRVVRRVDDRTYIVDINGSEKALSTDQLKPAYYETSDEASQTEERQAAQPSEPTVASEPTPPPDPTPTAQPASATHPRTSAETTPPPTRARTRRVAFSLPSPNARSTGRGVAVALSTSQSQARRSRRCLGLPPSSNDR